MRKREAGTKGCADCFAYRGTRCNALTHLECADGAPCSFYLPAEEFKRRRQRYPIVDVDTRKRPGR